MTDPRRYRVSIDADVYSPYLWPRIGDDYPEAHPLYHDIDFAEFDRLVIDDGLLIKDALPLSGVRRDWVDPIHMQSLHERRLWRYFMSDAEPNPVRLHRMEHMVSDLYAAWGDHRDEPRFTVGEMNWKNLYFTAKNTP